MYVPGTIYLVLPRLNVRICSNGSNERMAFVVVRSYVDVFFLYVRTLMMIAVFFLPSQL